MSYPAKPRITPMNPASLSESELLIRDEIERALMDRHGPLVAGFDLCRALGYPSAAAFRQAILRDSVPIPVFRIPTRRGRFALTRDVAAWLAACRALTNTRDIEEKEHSSS